MQRFWLSVILILSFAFPINCAAQKERRTQLNFNKDLFPEGIAIDPDRKRLFLNSLTYDKIVTSNMDGSDPIDFIASNLYNYPAGFGMTVMGDTLYALGNELVKADNRSVLLMLNAKTGNLIDTYILDTPQRTYFNDLAVSGNDELFITDSESNTVYKINRPDGEIEIFLQRDAIAHSNGIAIAPDSKLLYLATQNGVRVVAIETKEVLNAPNKENLGIDGLKYFENSLIGIINVWKSKPENNGIFRFFLDEEGKRIIAKEKILSFSEEDGIPTTFDLVGNTLFFVMDTQLDNFDEHTKRAIDPSALESYQLMNIQLD